MRWLAEVLVAGAALGAAVVVAPGCSGDDSKGNSDSDSGGGGDRGTTENALIVYEARQGQTTNVWTVDAETGELKQLTFDEAVSGHPAWAPDRSRIIYVSNKDTRPKRNIYTIAPDGSDPRRLTTAPELDQWSPKYSPDMKQIVYVEIVEDDGSYLALMDPDGRNSRHIAGPYKFAEFPAWTRDGEQVYFAAIEQGRNDIDIYAVDIETQAVKTIVSTPSADVCPHFTRDGKTLTYASAAPGDSSNTDLFARSQPFDGHTDIGDDVRLTSDPGFDDYSNTSPDDSRFVFLSRRDGNTELYLMDRDGENERRLTFTTDLEENVPDW